MNGSDRQLGTRLFLTLFIRLVVSCRRLLYRVGSLTRPSFSYVPFFDLYIARSLRSKSFREVQGQRISALAPISRAQNTVPVPFLGLSLLLNPTGTLAMQAILPMVRVPVPAQSSNY